MSQKLPWPKQVEKAKRKVTEEQYSKFLRCVDLQGVYLDSLKASFPIGELKGKGSFDMAETIEEIVPGECTARIVCGYIIKARSGRRLAADIRATFRVLFVTTEEVPKDFFVIFAATSLPLHIFPYVRELVNNMFDRTQLPPLVLPLRKYLLKPATPAKPKVRPKAKVRVRVLG